MIWLFCWVICCLSGLLSWLMIRFLWLWLMLLWLILLSMLSSFVGFRCRMVVRVVCCVRLFIFLLSLVSLLCCFSILVVLVFWLVII